MLDGGSISIAESFKRMNVIGLIIAVPLACLLLCQGCGPKEDPELVRERAMVTQGIEILRTGTPVQRDSVIRTFYKLDNPGLLHPYLDDRNHDVRIGMVSALGFLKDKSAADRLNALLTTVDDYLLQETIIYALGEIADTSTVPILIGLLNDESVNRNLRLSIPITLASFAGTTGAGDLVEKAFMAIFETQGDDVELCSYVSVGILEVLNPGNAEAFSQYLPLMRRMAEKRKAESGEDGIWTNFQLTIQELESYQAPAS